MRISLVSEHANPLAALGGADAGGQNVHVAALAGGLARRGHDVTVHTRRDDETLPDRIETEDGYTVSHVPAGPATAMPKDDLLPHMTEMGLRLAEEWRRERPDLVHAHFWMSGLAALIATRGTDVPVVQTFHALGSVKRRHQGAQDTSPPTRIDLERRLCRDVAHVVATCHDEVAELRALGLPPSRASVIPCGVDTTLFRPPPDRHSSDRLRLVVVGRLVTRKGVGNVVEALDDLVHRQRLDVELLIAGGPPGEAMSTDPEVRRLRALIDQHRVADRVQLLGSVARPDVPVLTASADVVVAVPWYEPFGIVPIEAMACGRPVVGSQVGGLLDTIAPGVTGELVPPRDPARLAVVLGDLLGDPDRCRRYGEAGRRRAVERYDWQAVVASTEAVYDDLLHHESTLAPKEASR